MIFKKNIADRLEDNIMELIEKHKEKRDFKSQAELAGNKAEKAGERILAGAVLSGVGAVAGVGGLAASLHFGVGLAVIAGTGMTIGGAILVGGVIGIAGPALAYSGINKMIKMHHESVQSKNQTKYGGNYIQAEHQVASDFSNKLGKLLGRDSELYKKAYESGLVNDIKDGYRIDANTKKLLDMTREQKVSSKDVNRMKPSLT